MNNLTVTEFKGIRVLTTQQLAESYETTDKKIRDNFSNNQARYIEGKHFIKLEGEELKSFKDDTEIIGTVGNRASSVYLWTEKGAFLHAKSLSTDKAWEIYDILVDTYFKAKEQTAQLSPELQMFQSLFKAIANTEVTTKQALEQSQSALDKVNSIREVVSLDTTSWRDDTGNLLRKISVELGGGQAFSQVRTESYELLNKRFGVDVKIRLTNKRRRMADEGVSKSRRDKLSYLDVIAEDKKLVEGYVTIVKDMAIRYGVA